MTRFTLAILLFATLACTGGAPTTGVSPVPEPSHPAPAPVSAESRRQNVPLYQPDELYKPRELQQMTLRELSLRRNTIYALVGNPFVKKWLRDYFDAQPWYHPSDHADLSKLSATDKENAERIGKVESSFTAAELRSRLDPLLAKQKAGDATPEDRIEIKLLSEALGDPSGAGNDGDPLSHPKMLDRELDPSQLSDLSRRDLRLLRNTIFARHGREFQSDQLRAYFEQKAWYHPNPRYSDSMLTEVDKANIATIVAEENERGGNVGDGPGRGDDGDKAPFSGA